MELVNIDPNAALNNLEAERATLGSVLWSDREAAAWISENLLASDFYFECHRHIYRAACSVYFSDTPTDEISISNWLNSKGLMEKIGGYAYLVGLAEATPTAQHVAHYGTIVRNLAILRDAVSDSQRTIREAMERPDDIGDFIAGLEHRALSISNRSIRCEAEPLSNWIGDAPKLLSVREGRTHGLDLGFKDLDVLTGGIGNTDLMIGGARTSMGKSSILVQIAINVASHGTGVLIYSREMKRHALLCRFLANLCERDSMDFQRHRLTEEALEEKLRKHADNPLPIFIHTDRTMNHLDTIAHARREVRKNPEIGLVIIDHLQTFPLDGKQSPHHATKRIMDDLKTRLCEGLERPLLLMSQISRESESTERKGNRRPELRHLKESGSIEEVADFVWMLYRESYYLKDETTEESDTGITELRLWKSRMGRRGLVKLYHTLSECRYIGCETEREEPAYQPERLDF